MAYPDAKFNIRQLVRVLTAASFGTTTASSATGADTTPSVYLPAFFRRTAVTGVKFIVTTIPDAGSTALKANLLNGTSTFATVALTTATAGQVLTGTLASNNTGTFTASGQPTITVTGTSTASADAQGSYTVDFEVQELFS